MDIEGNGALLIRNETFAADTEQGDTSDLNGQLHEIMDIEGSGPLSLILIRVLVFSSWLLIKNGKRLVYA